MNPGRTHAGRLQQQPPRRAARSPLPAIVLGVGLGGFVDGIVLHQILQWHHMLSNQRDHPTTTVAGLEDNTLADGLFHAATWLVVIAGIWLLWRQATVSQRAPSGRVLAGWMLVGWGLFNLVEGVIDHQLLRLHHVRDDLGGPLSWDVGFLVASALLVAVGLALARSHQPGRDKNAARGA
jgi:uncharacterized membrane protein